MRGFRATTLDDYIALQEGINDHRIRAILRLSGRIDEGRLRAAALRSAAVVPLLACGYARRGRGGLWTEGAKAVDESRFYSAAEAAPGPALEAEIEKALAFPIDQEAGPQFHVTRIGSEGRDLICIVMNHVVMDGSGFKTWLELLARLYSGGGPAPGDSRVERDVLGLIGAAGPAHSRAGVARRGQPRRGEAIRILASPNGGSMVPEARTRRFRWKCERADLEAIRKAAGGNPGNCAESGPRPSVNDCAMALVAAAVGAAIGEGECREGPLELAFMVDARRYDETGLLSPYSNASSMESISIDNTSLPVADLAAEIAARTAGIKRARPGLANLAKIRRAKGFLPPPIFRAMLRRKMRATRLSTTNLGAMDPSAFRFGELDVEDLHFVTALKEEPGLQFTFSTFGEGFTITSYGRYSEANSRRIASIYAGFDAVRDAVKGAKPGTAHGSAIGGSARSDR